MKELIENIRNIEWPKIDIGKNQISILETDIKLVEVKGNHYYINFYIPNENEKGIIEYKFRYNSLHTLIIQTDIDVNKVLTTDFKLRFYRNFNDIFKFKENKITSIHINTDFDKYEVEKSFLKIHPDTFFEICEGFNSIYEISKSYSNKLITYKSNQFAKNYFGIEREKKTLTNPGEFSFLIDRFCLDTKRTSKDFLKYLNSNDIIDIQEFSEKLIQHEIFSPGFLQKLNDYFIKIRLTDVINLGNKILKLKSDSIKTKTARDIISKVESDGRRIKQFENVWQKYFEKYLLYLIFSYQSIHSKIRLNVNLKKKYPDFIGVNHYGGVDVIEIKTHTKNALTRDSNHDNYAFSSELSKAIIQTINYMDALVQEKIAKKKEREDIKGKILEGNIYRPRGIIIISSYKYLASGVKEEDKEFEKVKRDFTKLRNGLNNIQILTFDEIINMADNYVKNIIK